MNFIYPKISPHHWRGILVFAIAGAFVAGVYGILHDQITYTIAPEYFTCFKFAQFSGANFGLMPRVFVAEIGFLATWWVGFCAGWFLARIAVPSWPMTVAIRRIGMAFAAIFIIAVIAAGMGYGLGILRMSDSDYADWGHYASQYGVKDLPRFVLVGYIHNASYLGGGIALLGALLCFYWLKKSDRKNI